jgi:hypothetical protein
MEKPNVWCLSHSFCGIRIIAFQTDREDEYFKYEAINIAFDHILGNVSGRSDVHHTLHVLECVQQKE